jgi:cytochrome c oxidase subunit 3
MSTVKTDSLGNKYAEHYESAYHQHDTGIHGVWLFLVTEVMMFSGLFVAYIIFKGKYPEVFYEAHKFLDWRLGALNTFVLLTSSLTMALGIHYIQKGQNKTAIYNLAATIFLGFCFMAIKYVEYSHKIHDGLLPGKFFFFEGAENANLALFFGLYFCMTGLHGLHVVAGMCLIGWVLYRTARGDFRPTQFTAVEGVGLFWHLVDLIWIYLFPLLYLVS